MRLQVRSNVTFYILGMYAALFPTIVFPVFWNHPKKSTSVLETDNAFNLEGLATAMLCHWLWLPVDHQLYNYRAKNKKKYQETVWKSWSWHWNISTSCADYAEIMSLAGIWDIKGTVQKHPLKKSGPLSALGRKETCKGQTKPTMAGYSLEEV